MGFFKSFFTGQTESPETEQEKKKQKNFEIFKYDGIRAQRMGRSDYALKCFEEALKIHDDLEVAEYMVQAQLQNRLTEAARQTLQHMAEMKPDRKETFLTLANVCYVLKDYDGMANAARQAITIDKDEAKAYYLLGKAVGETGDSLMSVAHLTQAIALDNDFTDAYLLRTETLMQMQQWNEAREDIGILLSQDAENENAYLLSGKLKEATADFPGAEDDYKHTIELNPFNEHAYLALSQLFIAQNKLDEAIALLNDAIDNRPDFAQAYQERGRAKLLKGDKEGSLEDTRKSIELAPKEMEQLTGTFNSGQPPQRDILGL